MVYKGPLHLSFGFESPPEITAAPELLVGWRLEILTNEYDWELMETEKNPVK